MPDAVRHPAPTKPANLMIRLDRPSKGAIARAARLRGVSASDYVRSIVVPRARLDADEAATRTIALAPDEQLAFWKALQEPAKPTPRQRELGRLMRGKG